MRAWLLLIAACALCACSDDSRAPPRDPGNDAGDSGTSENDGGVRPDAGGQTDGGGQTDAGPDAASPVSPLERPPELPRPPAGRLPDDLKPPVR
ncbi:hypothetical protein [Sorangium sp. So ce1078]|uniref:hypothetical protein n=1 Tax=Sorangium sp. So ce1078 TaxID=3133329 RepID=UPI003F5E929F